MPACIACCVYWQWDTSHQAASPVLLYSHITCYIKCKRLVCVQVMMDFLKEWETKLAIKITCSQVCAFKHWTLPQLPSCNLWKPVLPTQAANHPSITEPLHWTAVSEGSHL